MKTALARAGFLIPKRGLWVPPSTPIGGGGGGGGGGGASPLPGPVTGDTNNLIAYGFDGAYSGQTINGGDGFARFQPISNIDGLGLPAQLHAIYQGDPVSSGSGMRAELGGASPNAGITAGVECAWAWAMKIRGGYWHGNEPSTSDQVIFQVHQYNNLATPGPTLGLMTQGNGNRLALSRVWGYVADPGGNSSVNGHEVYPAWTGATNSRPADNTWTRFVLRVKFGWSTSFSPIIQLYINESLECDLSGSSALIGTENEQYYFRHGFYKWTYGSSANWGSVLRRSAYYSPVAFGIGANRVAEGHAYNAGYTGVFP